MIFFLQGMNSRTINMLIISLSINVSRHSSAFLIHKKAKA